MAAIFPVRRRVSTSGFGAAAQAGHDSLRRSYVSGPAATAAATGTRLRVTVPSRITSSRENLMHAALIVLHLGLISAGILLLTLICSTGNF
ncbi:MAG: hypothetical protein ACLGP3_02240, partial [Acidobacteriota bacterium]